MAKVQKAKKVVGDGPLFPVDERGNFIVSDVAEAKMAITRAVHLTQGIEKIKSELKPLDAELQNLRKALNQFQAENGLAEIVSDGWKSDFVERTGSMWVWDEIPEALEDAQRVSVIPLKKILKRIRNVAKRKEIMDRITKTVLVPEAIDDVVKEGLLTAEMVEPAYIEYVSTTYVQIKEAK